MAKKLDDHVHQFLLQPVEHTILYPYIDASYYKVRDRARDVTKAVQVVARVREDGYREILDAGVTNHENEEFCRDCSTSSKNGA